MTHPPLIRVLIADDHPVVRDGLALMLTLRPGFEVLETVSDGQAAVEAYGRLLPDVLLLDLRLPLLDGVGVVRQIRAAWSSARILILTTYNYEEDIYTALRAGAKGYLLKDASTDEIVAAIQAVSQDTQYIPPAVGTKLVDRAMTEALTEREHDVLRELVRGKSNAEIGLALAISEGTVKYHCSHLLAKLGASDRTQAIIIALRRGLIRLD